MRRREFIATAFGIGVTLPSILTAAPEGEGKEPPKLDKLFKTGPYLQHSGNSELTVMWLTEKQCYSWVEWGTTEKLGKKAHTIIDGQIEANNTLNKIKLAGLKEGKTYFYRICSREITHYGPYKVTWGKLATSPIKKFTTSSSSADSIKCVIFNDLHDNLKMFSSLTKQIANIDYDFSIFNGDCFNDPPNEDYVLRSLKAYNHGIKSSEKPAVYLRGNHEIRGAYSREWPGLIDTPTGKQYYALTKGPVRFIFMDCGEDKPDNHWAYSGLNDFEGFHREQAEWLKEEVKSEAFKKAKFRVLVNHIPFSIIPATKYNPWSKLWGPILNNAGVDMAISGHTHRVAILPPKAGKHNYPLIIGGGKRMEDGTVTVFEADNHQIRVKIINTKGEELGKYQVKS